MTSSNIEFIYQDRIYKIINPDSNETLLNYVRTKLKKTGTKEGCAEGGCEELHRVGRVDEKEKEEACGEQSVSDIALGVCGGGALRLTRALLLLLLNGPAYCERNRKEDKRANGAQHEEEVEACTGEGAAEWHHLEEVELEQREPPGHTDVERRVRDREDDLERAENLHERDEDLAFGAQRLRALSAAAPVFSVPSRTSLSRLNGSCDTLQHLSALESLAEAPEPALAAKVDISISTAMPAAAPAT